MTLNDSLFNQTYNQLLAKGFTGNLQLYARPIDFSFGVAPAGQISAAAYQVISGMPQWSEVGGYDAQAGYFFDYYKQVLTHVTWKVSPEQQNDLTKLQDGVTTAQNAVTTNIQNMNQAWVQARDQGGAVFAARYADINSWLAGPGKSWTDNETQLRKTQDTAQEALQSLVRAYQPQTLQQAMEATKLPSGNPVNDSPPRGWVKVADGAGNLRWQPEYKIGTSGEEWRAKLAGGSQGQFSLTLKASEENTSLTNSWAGAKASYGTPFWGVNTSGSWSTADLSSADKSVSVTISAKSSTVVPVTPGAWYDGGFMSGLAKATQGGGGQGWTITAPWVAQGAKGSSSLFGQNGLLSASVEKLVVVYKPSFEITMSENTFKAHSDQYKASLGVRIGPFTFGGSGGHSNEWTHKVSGSTSFTGESTSDDPLIIGAIIAFPGTGSK